ncbi:MAG: thermonuclease family protein [Candidatus Methylomirabilales bacterium]
MSITRRPHTALTVLFTLLSLLSAVSVLPTDNGIDPQAAPLVRVVRVIDGDTIEVCCIGWRRESIRYIGIDTPETSGPTRTFAAYGKEAKEANRKLVDGKAVRLEFDVRQRDKHGRLLAYVYLEDGTFVNARLVQQGYAQVMTVPPNVKHQELFLKLQREAREARRGLWR